jgi:hypothetical protein
MVAARLKSRGTSKEEAKFKEDDFMFFYVYRFCSPIATYGHVS